MEIMAGLKRLILEGHQTEMRIEELEAEQAIIASLRDTEAE